MCNQIIRQMDSPNRAHFPCSHSQVPKYGLISNQDDADTRCLRQFGGFNSCPGQGMGSRAHLFLKTSHLCFSWCLSLTPFPLIPSLPAPEKSIGYTALVSQVGSHKLSQTEWLKTIETSPLTFQEAWSAKSRCRLGL